ncbi:MAG TPA: twin transmembrane helix small protein [Plasticicumulans sp.]|nr:twin transmembrane helix small protein [Pseudomonadota bacterium]HMW28925.1 twin transmembrane helix small protein [Plasticicumulans sp.]HMW42594.1 twin transmembrane helix small protein [Plasticicumulans sp.]HMX53475.1 twin transmembrane helix small protein [Plasticicumulans sp.]HMZ09231.1 twin transmembrane helix small protein [Plasticicumulans sp.]
MLFRVLVIAALLAIVASLGSGLFFLVRERERSERLVRALTVRIALSIGLFVLLLLAWAAGLVQPHGVH